MAPIALPACSARQRRVRLLREGERLPQRHTAKGCSPWQPGSARPRRQGVPGPRPIHRQGTEQPPEAGSSGFPPPLGVSPGPPRELRFSPTKGTGQTQC